MRQNDSWPRRPDFFLLDGLRDDAPVTLGSPVASLERNISLAEQNAVEYHRDADGDGFGDAGQSVLAKSQPEGYVNDDTDCDEQTVTRSAGSGFDDIGVQEQLYKLMPETEYYFRLTATNSSGTAFDEKLRFVTDPITFIDAYIEPAGLCDGKAPCFQSIQKGIHKTGSGTVLRVGCGTFAENIVIDGNVTLEIGWDQNFTDLASLASYFTSCRYVPRKS